MEPDEIDATPSDVAAAVIKILATVLLARMVLEGEGDENLWGSGDTEPWASHAQDLSPMKAGPKPQPTAGELPKLRARTAAGRVRPKGRKSLRICRRRTTG